MIALYDAEGIGGSGRGIGNGLQAEGRERLREFITAGGGYLGVCAGAYFAGSGLENYLHAIPLKHSQPWARGPAMLEIELTDEGLRLLVADQRVLTTRYNNGPVFLDSEQADGGDLIISPHPESHPQHDPLVARAIQWTMEPERAVSTGQWLAAL